MLPVEHILIQSLQTVVTEVHNLNASIFIEGSNLDFPKIVTITDVYLKCIGGLSRNKDLAQFSS